jgi:hypothetical protein
MRYRYTFHTPKIAIRDAWYVFQLVRRRGQEERELTGGAVVGVGPSRYLEHQADKSN